MIAKKHATELQIKFASPPSGFVATAMHHYYDINNQFSRHNQLMRSIKASELHWTWRRESAVEHATMICGHRLKRQPARFLDGTVTASATGCD